MGCGIVFLHLALLVVSVRGQACQEECRDHCGTTGLNRSDPGGNEVNIAYGKPTEISSRATDSEGVSGPGCMLVNGNTSSEYRTLEQGNANCVYTDPDDLSASWWVDLGRESLIANITIYIRAQTQRRLAGLSVLVENFLGLNHTCYSFPNKTNASALDDLPEKIDITCDPALLGQKVWLQKHGEDGGSNDNTINVCEVQVWGCGEAYTGADCSCGHCIYGAICDTITGTCPNGRCDNGWQAPYCNQSCSPGWHGDCTEECGQCKDLATCDVVTGHCPPKGCEPGKMNETTCKEDCQDGFYGYGCNFTCGNCTDGAACDKGTGTCPKDRGCQPGFEPSDPFCFIRCRSGTYGQDCGGACGQCQGGEACDTATGHCSACQTALPAPLCQEKISESGPGVGVVVGASVAVIVVLVVIAVVIFIVIRRSRRKSDSGAASSNPNNGTPNTSATERPPAEIVVGFFR